MNKLKEFQEEAMQVYYDLKFGKIDRQKAKEMNASLNIVIKSGLLAIMEAQARSQMPTKQLFSNNNVLEHKD